MADEFARYGVHLMRGTQNDVSVGIRRVKEYLTSDDDHIHPFRRSDSGGLVRGSPRLFITENCHNLISEFGLYRWSEPKSGVIDRNEREEPTKDNDHAMDALRYYVLTHLRPLTSSSEDVPTYGTPAYFMYQQEHRGRSRRGDVY